MGSVFIIERHDYCPNDWPSSPIAYNLAEVAHIVNNPADRENPTRIKTLVRATNGVENAVDAILDITATKQTV
jgi:hypothetical protein